MLVAEPIAEPIIVTPAANPAALGLVGFGLTTMLLSFVNAGLLPPGGESVVVPLALAYGGLAQIIAGLLEFRQGNTFGMTAFLSYGCFWLWFALLQLFAHTGAVDVSAAGPTVGTALILWGVLTLYLWISTFRMPRILFLVFLTLWITFFLLGFGAALGVPALSRGGGWLGILSGGMAMYASFGLVTNATAGRAVIPIGDAAAR